MLETAHSSEDIAVEQSDGERGQRVARLRWYSLPRRADTSDVRGDG